MPVTKHIVWHHNCSGSEYVGIKQFDDLPWKEMYTEKRSPFCRSCGENLEAARKEAEEVL